MSRSSEFLNTFFDKITSRSPSPAGLSPSRPPALVPRQTLSTQYAYCADAGYEFNNNLWGQHDAESGSQVTNYYGPVTADTAGGSTSGGVSWGSTWTWKGAPDNVKSYVWVNRQFDRPLLCDVTALPTRTIWSCKGKSVRGNVAYDIFTHRDKGHANSSGEYEIMIWLASYGGLWPISKQGRPLETVTIAGYKFDLHFGYNGAMKVYSFVATKGPIFDFSADVLDFFRHLEQKYAFPMREQYMLIYQFGPEAVTGRDVEFYNARFEADVHVRQ